MAIRSILLMLAMVGPLFASPFHPYFAETSWRTGFAQRDPAPRLFAADSAEALAALPDDAKAIDLMVAPTDQMWDELKRRTGLDELLIVGSFSRTHIDHLKAMPSLQRVGITIRGQVTKQDLAGLADLKLSGFLYITCTDQCDLRQVADQLPQIPCPLRMYMGATDPKSPKSWDGEAALPAQAIALMPNLRFLHMRDCVGFDNAFCEALSKSKSLQAIGGQGQAFDALGLAALLDTKKLAHIMLDRALKVSAPEVASALKNKSLETFVFYKRDAIDAAVIGEIARMRSMTWLEISIPESVPDDAVKKLGALKNLVLLSMYLFGAREPACFEIVLGMRKLESLIWSNRKSPSDATLKRLAGLRDLRELELRTPDLKTEHLKVIADYKKLQYLHIGRSESLRVHDLLVLTQAPSLKKLVAAWPDDSQERFAKIRPDVELVTEES